MDEFRKARETINELDRQMASLFEKRMEQVRRIAGYKMRNGIPILDAQREAEVLKQNLSFIQDPTMKEWYMRFQKQSMGISRQFQRELGKGLKVAWITETAEKDSLVESLFPGAQVVAYSGMQEGFAAVEQGECSCCMLPLHKEEEDEILVRLSNSSLSVTGLYDLKVTSSEQGRKKVAVLARASDEDLAQLGKEYSVLFFSPPDREQKVRERFEEAGLQIEYAKQFGKREIPEEKSVCMVVNGDLYSKGGRKAFSKVQSICKTAKAAGGYRNGIQAINEENTDTEGEVRA